MDQKANQFAAPQGLALASSSIHPFLSFAAVLRPLTNLKVPSKHHFAPIYESKLRTSETDHSMRPGVTEVGIADIGICSFS